jgi:hypothetical protein
VARRQVNGRGSQQRPSRSPPAPPGPQLKETFVSDTTSTVEYADDDSGDFTVTFLMTASPEAAQRLGQTRTDLARSMRDLGDDEAHEKTTTPEQHDRTPDEWWQHAEAFLGGTR